MIRKRREHPFDLNWRTTTDYRGRRPLFNDMDRIGGKNRLIDYAIGEVEEVREELDVAGQPNQQKVADELNDVFNMLVPITVLSFGKDFQPSNHLFGVNGAGKHSNALEKLSATLADTEDDSRAVIEAYRLLWSIGSHTISTDENARILQIMQTYQKVSNNYPETLYSGKDLLTGQALSEDEKPVVFDHTTRGLKMIRKNVQRTLKPQDVSPYQHLLTDWRNSKMALEALSTSLEPLIKTENGVAQFDNQVEVPAQEITIQINQKNGILFSNS